MIYLRKREIEFFYKDLQEQHFFEGNFKGSTPEDFNALMELRSGVIGSRAVSEEKLEDEVWGQVSQTSPKNVFYLVTTSKICVK